MATLARRGRHRQPRLAGGEAAAAAGLPRQRVAEAVAAEAVQRQRPLGAVGNPELVALVDEGAARQREQQQGGQGHVLGPDPVGQALEVVVGEHPGNAGEVGGGGERGADGVGGEGRVQELEAEGHVQVAEIRAELGVEEIESGAFTGEVSGAMLCDAGATMVIVGEFLDVVT